MKIQSLLILILTSMCLSGCLDHWYPNELSGSISDNSVYTSHTRYGRARSFDTYSVMVPERYNEYQMPMYTATEKMGTDYTYVIFGPAITDHTIYRLMIATKGYNSMAVVENQYFRAFINSAEKDADRHWTQIYETNTTVNGHPALYRVYANTEPSVYHYINKRQPGNVDITNAVYFVDYGKYGVIFWFRYHSDSAVNQVTSADRPIIISQRFKPQQDFLRSFHINEWINRCCST